MARNRNKTLAALAVTLFLVPVGFAHGLAPGGAAPADPHVTAPDPSDPFPPYGARALDAWVDARGDTMYGDLAMGSYGIFFRNDLLKSPTPGFLAYGGIDVCLKSGLARCPAVTQVDTSDGLTGGPITLTGTIGIADGGVTGAQLAADAVTSANVVDGSIQEVDLGFAILKAGDVAAVQRVDTGDGLTGGPITNTGTIGLADAGVTAAKLAPDAVTSAHILDATVLETDLAFAVLKPGDDVGVLQVDTGDGLTGGPITTTGTIGLADGGVTGAKLAADAVTGAHIADGTVQEADLAFAVMKPGDDIGVVRVNAGAGLTGGPITDTGTLSIADGGVTRAKLATDAVGSGQIEDGTVAIADLAFDPFTQAEFNAAPVWRLGGNAGTTSAHFIGTTDNRPLELRVHNERALQIVSHVYGSTLVGGDPSNDANGQYAVVIAGGSDNVVGATFSTISGGHDNNVSSEYAVVSGGRGRVVTGSYGAVAGGRGNAVSGLYGSIAGGQNNAANAYHAAVGGGRDNAATAQESRVGGGSLNTASGTYAVVAGGRSNGAESTGAFIGGGYGNVVDDAFGVVAGGHSNLASGRYAAVLAGDRNQALGWQSTVAGGLLNTASGSSAFVPGGANNVASGPSSFAAGVWAEAAHPRSFVWSDGSQAGTHFRSTMSDQFSVQAGNGVRLFTSAGQATGCTLAGGSGAWSCTSDRDAKTDFALVDPENVLQRVADLPVTTWRYKGDDARHMGPVAQDFSAAFGLGDSDTTIAHLDADGVALAAIKALAARTDAQAADLAALEARLAAEQARNDALALRIAALDGGARASTATTVPAEAAVKHAESGNVFQRAWSVVSGLVGLGR